MGNKHPVFITLTDVDGLVIYTKKEIGHCHY